MDNQKIKEEIKEYLEHMIDYDRNKIKLNIDNLMMKYKNNYEIANYKIVCDNSNNITFNKEIRVDVYIQPYSTTGIIVNNIVILPDKIKALRKMRKQKLNKIMENFDGY